MSNQPLAGRRILVTRARHQASELAERLEAMGATPIQIPTIEIGPPSSYSSLDAALARLSEFDLVAFTSANAVDAFNTRREVLRIHANPKRIAVVGRATERALNAIGLHADVVPTVFTAESLGQALRDEAGGRRILLALAENAPNLLRDALAAAGGEVTVAAAYSNHIPESSIDCVQAVFGDGDSQPDAITFTSASSARNLLALLDSAKMNLPVHIPRASIGPITSRALVELGLAPVVEAKEATIGALVEALADYFRLSGDQSCIAAPV